MIYQFAHHENVPEEHPTTLPFQLHEKLSKGEELDRVEKDELAMVLYGLFGNHPYKLAGWAVSFHDVLPRYLVNLKHYGWKEFYSADKVSLRKALITVGTPPIEIVEAPRRKK